MTPLGQEVDTDGIESEELINQRPEVWPFTEMASEGSNGQSDMCEQDGDHGSIQG